eukprot:COSAG01_NODE_63288_length_280_cov_1.430939_1_plen_62_part_10
MAVGVCVLASVNAALPGWLAAASSFSLSHCLPAAGPSYARWADCLPLFGGDISPRALLLLGR